MKQFKKICRMSQEVLKDYVVEQLSLTHKDIVSADGFVYAQGTFPVLLVAHMDTVHQKLPDYIVYNQTTKTLSAPQGIGGDDRCGVYMILQLIKQYNCSVLFCEDEEIGCVGALKFCHSTMSKSLIGKFQYIIEFDRQGSNDAVFYECDNIDFEEFITEEYYKLAFGSFSDISYIAPHLNVAAVNLSCGYHKPHTKDEYVSVPEMHKSIEQAGKILARTLPTDTFEYIENISYFKDMSKYNYGSFYYIIEFEGLDGRTDWFDVCANCEAEAIGMWCIQNPKLTYNHIIAIDEDYI